ncbi:MAG: MBOAT family protein [Clostridia bacterium]|nr:MBOAT family protein [Clostridia bacterium]
MVFSSFTFLFIFLPLVLLTYFLAKKRQYRNIVLLVFSLIFYAWGEPVYVLLMLLSIIVNYLIALKIERNKKGKNKWMIIDVIFNLGIIGFFKYGNFVIQNINSIFHSNIGEMNLALPIGISFYTFQVLSYVIDVYRKTVPAQKSIVNLGMYVTLFPQLIAGPIVRYETVAEEIENRKENFTEVVEGLKRFFIGLGKKVLIANQMALIADTIYGGDLATTGTVTLWLAAISYTLQIYFDFSGYSDMAIGLGRIFGFHFLENFNYPYVAKSITDFWRRWHISLSTWFRDYVYIPLGGNRVSKFKWLRNILVVWLLTGLWHGASWNFILWGVYYGIILMIEKVFLGRIIEKLPKVLQHIYALFFIIIGWVIFRVEDFSQMGIVLQKMFTWQASGIIDNIVLNFDIFSSLPYVLMGIIGSVPLLARIRERKRNTIFYQIVSNIWIFGIFILSICFLLVATYNPFIYFRF